MNREPFDFANACNGLVSTVRDAANPAYPAWVPYRGNMIEVAVWWARRVAHMARRELAAREKGVTNGEA